MSNFLLIDVPVWVAGLIFVFGAVGGFMVQVGWYEFHGRRVIVPFISRSARNFTIIAMALAVLSFATIVQSFVNANRAEDCDRQFREALAYNTELNSGTRALDDRQRQAQDDSRRATANLVKDLATRISTPPPPTRDETVDILNVYNAKAKTVAETLERIDAERDALNAARKPYPEPTCGR